MMKDNSSEAMKSDVDAVAIWEAKFKKDTLVGRDFREYWKLHVPTIYAPDESTNFLHISYDDDSAQKLLFDTLKQFICIDNPAEVLKHLKELTTPAALCGKVFRMGEATYSCRDCGQDSTCVLCRDCFAASAHQQHRYKMNQSVGGGYCDCGDREAWKDSFCCSIHERNAVGGGTSSLLKFPPEIVQRARAVFSAVLDYSLEMLTHENTMGLPHDLRSPLEQEGDADDLLSGAEPLRTPLYVTMFYNDETHTFEQVIECLRRAVECSQRDAVDYATIIDRVGRSIVKCGDFQTCNKAKQVFEHHSVRHSSGPYKVHVMHTHVVAHQTFAMRLLLWLKKLIEEVDGFRTLFGQIVTEPAADGPVLERVMKSDTQLWKLARNQWHLLLIQGMLMEHDSKKVFAKTFTRLYPALMRDFMCDDHNHSDSVTSLSVQIYTVPTIAYMLITDEDCLFVVTRTFYDECINRRNAQGVLSFDARSPNTTWRRISYCLNDLRYLLNNMRPPQWTDQLRKGFLHGFNALLDVLAVMEGMDSSVRQMGNHLEFDPEWQTAFTLFGKLSIVIYHLMDWCSSDRMVLVKAYRAVLRKLYGKLSEERLRPSATVTAAGKTFRVIEFDMWQKPVSLHLPLTRMLAGLHLHLGRFGLQFGSPEFEMEDRPTIQQIMETSLRAVILTTQVRAGMWRRNGTSLVSQVHFYSNVRIRSEIQDRDVQILQMAAALEDPDEFIMTLMLRYGIHHWLAPDFEGVMRRTTEVDGEPVTYFVETVQEGGKTVTNFVQTVQEFTHNLEEMMLVLIHVFGERYQPGVGEVTREDCLKKEIIQCLCIEPTPHSKLSKLVVAENHNVSIEQLADQVAEFKLPQNGTGKGVYELKPELYSDYNPFWYHYTREEQSRAEGAQRRRKRLADEPACLPPPQLPPFTPEFRAARNVAVCRAMLDVLLTVLRRSADLTARVFSETLFQRALFLMGLALNEEERSAAGATADAGPPEQPPAFCFSQPAQQCGIVDALQNMVGNPRVSSHADLLAWVNAKLNRLLGRTAAAPESQPSTSEEAGSEQKKRRAQAAARRARILGQMQAQQKKFITQNMTALAEPEEAEPSGALSAERAAAVTGSAMDLSEGAEPDRWPVCLGPRQSARPAAPAEYTCILCQATEQVSSTRPAMVMAAFVQLSTVLSRDRASTAANPVLYVPSSLHRLPHTSSCGHAMHAACWQRHFENVCQRERRRAHRLRHNMSYDVQKREFLCPLCQCLSNTVVPLVPARMVALDGDDRPPADNINVWVKGLQLACAHTVVQVDESPGADHSVEQRRVRYRSPGLKTVLKHMTQREGNQFRAQVRLGDRIAEIPTSTREMMITFAMVPCMVGLDGRVELGDRRVPLLTLQTCAYTLHTTEQLLRHTGRPLLAELGSRGDICLTQLTHVCATMLPVVAELGTAQASCLGLLRLLLDQPAGGPPVTDMDAFGLVVILCSLTTTLFAEHADGIQAPSGSLQDLQCVRLSLLLHLVQILLTLDVAELTRQQPMETDDEPAAGDQDEQQWLAELYTLVRSAAGVEVADVSPPLLRQYVAGAVTPFLRCCALYFHFLTGVRAPDELLQPLPLAAQYPHLLRYLGLDSLCVPQATDCQSVLQDLIAKWCRHPDIGPYLAGSRGPIVRYPLSVNTLIPLPVDFSELINKVSDFTCPSSDGESRVPAMCLACGELLCSQSYCCQVQVEHIGQIGACNAHLMRCGAGSGVMLRIRECRVHLLVNKVRGASVPPPYVDKFGEMDQGLNRGNPLTLWREQYDKLNRLWIAHGIPEEVTRLMEDSFSQTDWQNL
ncbi:E3 ubiquitin-protein ligase UBR2-like [Amphibalanus amphitrite]|uniref:E3 ubiquitin-protein ligase UBR2-like n=1 Tax=Amphibalanus amphitrite TaxID=1232801 RepID=UPI001C91B1B5|nr:E3 ubiquitin-protein ligase UBR2-like [Amphibalanus amphitrite]